MSEGRRQSRLDLIRVAIEKARRLEIEFGAELRKDAAISSFIEDYRAALVVSREVMERSAMIELCSACAAKTPGGCCFMEVEQWYDPVLLLVNILLGCSLPGIRELPGNCIFLGERGCRISGRYHFCVNYLCDTLKREIGGEMMEKVMSASGLEILKGAQLEYYLRRWFSLRGIDPD
ncbi:MAG: hypothetical protein COX16_13995 [Deltaproteobacteria bacterium CG23_combo_of_CG06-09_8_20_14_all_51_20]|nr:hypothetical protein [Deltaproteobacteria bacterium]NCP04331.1 hypothetical protein [Deltaproteobacteria bacterium]PIP45284.1 MAG: hypothetical protein COX16_13995 [Deltaproteobacteria bacterium CG23_combo_of_CG06-09_8_20_14_all_51_20]PIY26405.1 MAG: hypothetical protein COZ11_02780 [Deltaproteobacteria bacterium CG_4_10_14_3_um_filter_51_14]